MHNLCIQSSYYSLQYKSLKIRTIDIALFYSQNAVFSEMQGRIWEVVARWRRECEEVKQVDTTTSCDNQKITIPRLSLEADECNNDKNDNKSNAAERLTSILELTLNGDYCSDGSETMMTSSPSTSASVSPRGAWIQVDKVDVKKSSRTFINLPCTLYPSAQEDHV